MKKQGSRNFQTKAFMNLVVPGLFLLALMVCLPTFATAAGDPAGDAKIQAMKTDIRACLQPGVAGQAARISFSQKYHVPLSKLNEHANSGESDMQFICAVEYLTVAGAIIWEERRKQDNYNSGPYPYCVEYSKVCDHYNWVQGCLK